MVPFEKMNTNYIKQKHLSLSANFKAGLFVLISFLRGSLIYILLNKSFNRLF